MPEGLLTRPGILKGLAVATTQVFSDCEKATWEHPEIGAPLSEWLGERLFSEGRFHQNLQELYGDPGTALGPTLVQLEGDLGAITGHSHGRSEYYYQVIKLGLSTKILKDKVLTREGELGLPNVPRAVLELGPGFNGATMADLQAGALSQGEAAVRYVPVTRTGFIARFVGHHLIGSLERRHEVRGLGAQKARDAAREQARQLVADGKLDARTNGIQAATDALAVEQPGSFDLLVCSGLHLVAREELLAGIANARDLLTPAGRIVVRAPSTTREGWVGAEDMRQMGADHGFRLTDQGALYGSTHAVLMSSFLLQRED